MPNRLADETSPYLLQHADNPVQWFPWGEDAFERAEEEDKPIFLSVGYSSCHWCHVMAHESFEDPEIASVMNERFVNVKVDREERPDVDAVYMAAVQALTGRGGWPMSVFLTPSGEPFYAGTYWPNNRRHGMPSFPEVMDAVHDAWNNRRDEVENSASEIAEAIDSHQDAEAADEVDLTITEQAAAAIVDRAWDRDLGGFGRAPKFPQAMTISYLLDRHARTGEDGPLEAAVHSLDAMARGGIHDQVGGGFHRYSTDAQWLVPHFEKMLYDNALLLDAYAKAAAITGSEHFHEVVDRLVTYLVRDMRHDAGGFFSATDADSEGEEGKFFVWDRDEFVAVLDDAGHDGQRWADFFGVTDDGNWEDTNIPHEPRARPDDLDHDELDAVRKTLFEHREQRVHPGLDDKILTSWNALLIRSLARAGALLRRPDLVELAVGTAEFLDEHLVVDGDLHHTWKDGRASVPAFLEDIAGLAAALVDLYQVTGDARWYERAVELSEDAVERFRGSDGGYFQTADDAEALFTRPRETWDNAIPSGNSLLAGAFHRLSLLSGDGSWYDRATEIVRLLQHGAVRSPVGYGELLQTIEGLAADSLEVALVGPEDGRRPLEAVVWRRPRPGIVVAPATSAEGSPVPLLEGRTPVDGNAAAYVCRDFVCDRPVTDPDALAASLDAA